MAAHPLRSRARSPKSRLAALVLVFLFAFGFRVVDVEHMPPFVHWDEVNQAQSAVQILSGELPALGVGYNDNPNLTFLEHAPYLLFGSNLWALRIASALWGVLTLAVTYFAVRLMYGARAALFAALLMASAHLLIHYGRVAVNVLPAVLTTFLSIGLLLRAQRERTPSARSAILYSLAGVAAALNLYAYIAARPALIALLVLWLLEIPRQRGGWLAYLHHTVVMAGGFVVVAAPILWWYSLYPETLTSRAQTLSIFGESAHAINEELYGDVDTNMLLVQQTLRSLGGFVATGDRSPNYGIHAPLLDPLAAMLLLPGLAVAWLRARRITAALLLTMLATLIAGSIPLTNPTRVRITVPATTVVGSMMSRMSAASAFLATAL